MATFDEFNQSLDPDSGIRVTHFEKFIKCLFIADREWQLYVEDIEEVWLGMEYQLKYST